MLSAIVDNSTITAVQRVLGHIPVSEGFPIEGDISAFDQYLQTLLLYDEVAFLDDYKEEYRKERASKFPELVVLSENPDSYERMLQDARSLTSDMVYHVKNGDLQSDPMSQFLRAMDLHVVPAWYMQSSDWYLHLRLLANEADLYLEKYGALMSAIMTQYNQNIRTPLSPDLRLRLHRQGGPLIEDAGVALRAGESIEDSVKRFTSSLNWLALRSIFYILVANKYNCALSSHPIRHTFIGQYVADSMLNRGDGDIRRSTLDFFSSKFGEIRAESDRIIGTGIFEVPMPFIAGWAVGMAGTPERGLDHVLQIRHGPEAMALRSRFREIEDLRLSGTMSEFRREAMKVRQALNDDLSRLRSKFTGGVVSPEGIDVSVDLLTLSPTVEAGGMLSRLKSALPNKDRKAVMLLRSISNDIMNIPTLGRVADYFKLNRRVRSRTEFWRDAAKRESEEFLQARSFWKRPV
ncbi:hypothetical protein [Sphingomonas kyeonggiensis]|uniref:Uncharacterized protein n=1 Tax=Sphingomonas kyeonggiensis TaxID=1268553 RepID=A0A7W6JVX1_9SPHN|nr:hypothetical protein [Sphingomonas kyeonggiensis]MBB4100526.1 hypothetical protein [Sphingomonas kyeonggiensis]